MVGEGGVGTHFGGAGGDDVKFELPPSYIIAHSRRYSVP